jgi:DNA polymerase elongation subunit (family B)
MEQTTVPITKKIKRVVNGKSFRLIDFNTYDQSNAFMKETSSESGSADDDSVQKPKWKPKEAPKFIIQMFGLNEKGETCCIYVDDFSPFFFIRVSESWTKTDASEFMKFLKDKVGKFHAPSILSFEILDANKLYGFTAGKTDKFVKLVFKNSSVFNKVKNLWFVSEDGDYKNRKLVPLIYKNQTLDIYESFLPPVLRYFHINNVSPSGWVFVKTEQAREPEKKTTTCKYEYICKASDIKSQPDKMTRVPYKICSFDIEASSSHGDFPLPKKTYKRLATQLVDVFLKTCNPPNPPMDISRAVLLLKKVILTAFGMDKLEDIDLVYPKQMPNKEKVLKLIDLLQKTQLKNVKMMNDEEDNSHLLEIDRAFEKIKESSNAEGIEGVEGQELPSEFTVSEESKTFDFWNKPKTLTKSDLSNTLVDVLMNDKFTRDLKIDAANDSLTMLFPRLEGDKVTFIGSTFLRYGEPEPYLNHCVVLGSCDPVENAEIVSVSSELDLLLQWKDLIQRENPDIMIGYNIFGFDYEFLFRRAEENHCEREFLKLSRKEGEVCAKPVKQEGMFQAEDDDCELNIENPAPIKLATGEYHLKFVKMTGRLQIDMFVYFRRTFNLPSYKLDDVAGQNISDDVKRIEHVLRDDIDGPCTELFTSNIKGLHIGDFIHIEISGFTSDYYKNGHKFKVLDIDRGREVIETIKGEQKNNKYNVLTISGHEQIDMTKHIKWGMAKDDVSPADIFRLANGSASDRAIVAKYCIQDCNLVHHLMNKIDLITGYIEMSTICSVPINYLVFRGQSIKLTSFLAKKCREKNTLMPDLQKSLDKEGYEGAIVLPPKCSMYMDDSVACVDYSSLYPSGMISQNFSHDSKVWVKEYNLAGILIKETGEKDDSGKFKYDNLPGYKYIDIEFDNFKWLRDPEKPRSKEVKTKVGKFVVRWAQLPQGEKSILPAILEQLLGARAATRKKIKTEPDPFMQNILEKRQIGYKETANSLYGACGASVSPFYEKDVAACTTATGRMMIIYAKRIIEEVYGNLEYNTDIHGPVKCKAEYVYGDTDSVFFTFNLEDVKTGEKIIGKKALEMTIEIAQDAAQLCSKYLKPPMELSYEKTLMPFILLSKKRYVGMLYETDANKGKMKFMGLAIKRRDSCDYLKDVYGGILNILMGINQKTQIDVSNRIQVAIDYLNNALETLISGKVSMDKLTMTRQLRSEYKNPDQIAHNVLANRIAKRDPGNKPKSGDRMKYLVVCQGDSKDKLGERIETPEYILEKKIPIDYLYYIENQLMEPLKQLFGLALERIWELQGKTSAIKTFKKDILKLEEEFPDLETFMKKKEKHCSKKIEELLFKKFLTKIDNEKKKLQTINTFFTKK